MDILKLLASSDAGALFSWAYSQRNLGVHGGALGAALGGEPSGEESLGYL